MKVLITGANGQLGIALRRFAPADTEVVPLGRDTLDIANPTAVEAALEQGADVLINAAAYTDVEAAERSPAAAFAINSDAAALLARACAARKIRFVHVSTDFVFDGEKNAPYLTTDAPRPLNAYGASKLDGERRVLKIYPDACVMRTSWLHSSVGANFVTKLLQRMRSGAPLRVVVDEIGAPTSVHSLATALWRCAHQAIGGIHHWSDAGETTRFDYARAIGDLALEYGFITQRVAIDRAHAADFPSGAKRPRYSVLDTTTTQAELGIEPRPWLEGLKLTMRDIATGSET